MVRGWQFHLGAGALCLDFANTVSWRRSPAPVERLATFDDFVSWGRQSGLISSQEEKRACRDGLGHPRVAARLLREARSLREAIFAVAAAISERRPTEERTLRTLERWVQAAIDNSRLTGRERSYRWELPTQTEGMQRVLWLVALSAEELLTSPDADRIGQCSGKDCRWLWLDRTRNKSRRWCDMAVCGNRAKSHRHYQRRSAMT